MSELFATPFLVNLSKAVIKVLLDRSLQLRKLVHIVLVDIHNGQARSLLLVDNLTQSRLALDDGIRNTLSLAKSRQPNNQLNGLDIMGNQDKLGLLLLNQSGNVVQTKLDDIGGSLVGGLLFAGLGSSDGLQAILLRLLIFRAVLVNKSKNTAR